LLIAKTLNNLSIPVLNLDERKIKHFSSIVQLTPTLANWSTSVSIGTSISVTAGDIDTSTIASVISAVASASGTASTSGMIVFMQQRREVQSRAH
jgi:hypothetical protein